MNNPYTLLSILFFLCAAPSAWSQYNDSTMRQTPAPLYRDPIYDGAADPVMVYNRSEKNWWMFYTG